MEENKKLWSQFSKKENENSTNKKITQDVQNAQKPNPWARKRAIMQEI